MGRKLTHLAIVLLALSGLSGGEEVSTDRRTAEGRTRRTATPGVQAGWQNGVTPCPNAEEARIVLGADQVKGFSNATLTCRPLSNEPLYSTPAALKLGRRSVETSSRPFYFSLAFADLGSTELALAAGAHETNPLMRNRPLRIPLKLAAAEGFAAITDRLERDGHHGWAKVARGGALLITALVVKGNLENAGGRGR